MIRRIRKYPILKKDHPNISGVLNPSLDVRSKNINNLFKKTQLSSHSIHNLKTTTSSAGSSLGYGIKNNLTTASTTSCGPSDDEICCVMGITKAELEESSLLFVWK